MKGAPLPHAETFLTEMSAVMPLGYHLEIDGEMLWLTSPDGGRAGLGAYWLFEDVLTENDAVGEAVQTLNQIQQEIAEETAEPWPAESGAEYRGFPEPDGELDGNHLRLWFGDREQPVLELQPIDLGEALLRD